MLQIDPQRLRQFSPELRKRYLREGWWTDATLGHSLLEWLARNPQLPYCVWSAAEGGDQRSTFGAVREQRRSGGVVHPLAKAAVHADHIVDDAPDHRRAPDIAKLFRCGIDEQDHPAPVDQQRGDGMRLDDLVMVEHRNARRQRAHAAALLR